MSSIYASLKPGAEFEALIKQRFKLGIMTPEINSCPRCGGRIMFEPDPDFDYCVSCLMCGYVRYSKQTSSLKRITPCNRASNQAMINNCVC